MLKVDLQSQRGRFRLNAQFTAPTPGITAVFGRSGCGKTSLLNALAGLDRGATGRIQLDDATWLDSANQQRISTERRRVAYVFQDARLFPHYSVEGNLRYGSRGPASANTAREFDSVVELLGLSALLQRRPLGLSGGEKQRVAIGRALLSQPKLLLLDEPLASLDRARREEILPYLEKLRDAYALPMVLVSHQFEDVLRLANHLLVMESGTIAAAGDVASLSTHAAVQNIVGTQAIGTVLEGHVAHYDSGSGLATVQLPGHADSTLRVQTRAVTTGQRLRVQILARDLIVATEKPTGLSVRNQIQGVITHIEPQAIGSDGVPHDLLKVDIGGAQLLARITPHATQELGLRTGQSIWLLLKAVSTHAFATALQGPSV